MDAVTAKGRNSVEAKLTWPKIPVEQRMAAAAAQTGAVTRVLRAVVAAKVSCAFKMRGSLSWPAVRNPKIDTPGNLFPYRAIMAGGS